MQKNNHQVIFGLGNPGEKYYETRHNAGFIVLDEIKSYIGSSDFKFENKFNAEVSEKKLESSNEKSFLQKIFNTDNNKKIFLVKPHSFMNKSGEVVRKFIDFYKISPENIVVIHDDLDLPTGTYKISENSGSGGHNGIQNIINMLGTQKFKRIRIGVEKKEGRESRQISGEKFVLQSLSKEESQEIKSLSKKIDLNI